MYFDFHHHSINSNGIKNIRIGISEELPGENSWFSAGIHPWDIEDLEISQSLKSLSSLLINKHCVALGELGIDKNFGTNLDLQIQVFRAQVALAEEYQKKVLIIHCIKAFQEMIEEKKRRSNDFIWVLHGFNGSRELIQQLLDQGFYFSVGALLFQEKAKISKHLQHIPLERLFIESDQSSIGIKDIYSRVAQLLKMDREDLNRKIEQNLKQILSRN